MRFYNSDITVMTNSIEEPTEIRLSPLYNINWSLLVRKAGICDAGFCESGYSDRRSIHLWGRFWVGHNVNFLYYVIAWFQGRVNFLWPKLWNLQAGLIIITFLGVILINLQFLLYSVLTAPFPVQPKTNLRASLDIFICDPKSLKHHLHAQLRYSVVYGFVTI